VTPALPSRSLPGAPASLPGAPTYLPGAPATRVGVALGIPAAGPARSLAAGPAAQRTVEAGTEWSG
jgi:hypothetical protein